MYIRTQSYKAIDGTEGEIWKSEEMKERGGERIYHFLFGLCAHTSIRAVHRTCFCPMPRHTTPKDDSF